MLKRLVKEVGQREKRSSKKVHSMNEKEEKDKEIVGLMEKLKGVELKKFCF